MRSELFVPNTSLQVKPLQKGDIQIIDALISDLIAAGFMDSETIPSDRILSLISSIEDQLGLTWKSAATWDPLDRNLGGAVFISSPWRQVE